MPTLPVSLTLETAHRCQQILRHYEAEIKDLRTQLNAKEVERLELEKRWIAGKADQVSNAADKQYQRWLFRSLEQLENNCGELLSSLSGGSTPKAIWLQVNRENAERKIVITDLKREMEALRSTVEGHETRLQEQNTEIEDLSQEISYLRGQLLETSHLRPHFSVIPARRDWTGFHGNVTNDVVHSQHDRLRKRSRQD